jgi:FHA domain
MKLSLVLHDGGKLEFPFSKNSIIIGRSAQCDIVVPVDGMSRRHVQLDIKDGGIFITDLGSSNGVLIEGQKIDPNIATPYFTYLSLSFGAVSQATLDLEEIAAPVQSKVESSFNSAPQARKSPEKKTKIEATGSKKIILPAAAAKDDSKNKMMIKVVGFIVVLAIAAYFMTQDNEVAPPTPAEIYN